LYSFDLTEAKLYSGVLCCKTTLGGIHDVKTVNESSKCRLVLDFAPKNLLVPNLHKFLYSVAISITDIA